MRHWTRVGANFGSVKVEWENLPLSTQVMYTERGIKFAHRFLSYLFTLGGHFHRFSHHGSCEDRGHFFPSFAGPRHFANTAARSWWMVSVSVEAAASFLGQGVVCFLPASCWGTGSCSNTWGGPARMWWGGGCATPFFCCGASVAGPLSERHPLTSTSQRALRLFEFTSSARFHVAAGHGDNTSLLPVCFALLRTTVAI